MKVLLTGADGFIGSHLAERLVRDGHEVRALVIYNSLDSWGWLDSVPAEVTSPMEIVSGDIRDPALMRELASGRDAILHLAALIAIPYSYRAPDLYVQTNVQGTLNLLNAARDAGVGRFVHTSTSEVYGTARFVPMDESHPLQGQSPYSATKIAADQMVNAFFTSFELPTITIRPFNTYGPRQSARAVIPTIISQLASGKREVRLGALSPTRDFTYVPDTVSGFVRALEADGAFGETINLGAGFEVSMQETFDAIAEVMGVDAVAVSTSERARPERSEVERLFSNNSKAREKLGWSPGFAGIEGFKRGLAETAEWFRDPENLRRYRPDVYTV
jgi:dTDP-glucose 4,6-dehydratase/UDP-glucose 4-epimerase